MCLHTGLILSARARHVSINKKPHWKPEGFAVRPMKPDRGCLLPPAAPSRQNCARSINCMMRGSRVPLTVPNPLMFTLLPFKYGLVMVVLVSEE